MSHELFVNVDFNAPIIPGNSIGGIRLRDNITVLEKVIWDGFWQGAENPVEYRTRGLFGVTYTLGSIDIDVDVHNGTIFRIWARSGYLGTFDGIRPGMVMREALVLHPTITYNAAEQYFEIAGHGVRFDCVEEDWADPPEAARLDLPIISIVVVAEELEAVFENTNGKTKSWQRLSKQNIQMILCFS